MDMHALLDPLLPLWGICEHEGKTILMAAFPYLLPAAYYAGRNVSRYAVVRDYHAVCGARLEQACERLRAAFSGEDFRCGCDSTPLPEAALAEKAGLGLRGRHNLLITRKYGSWVFLGEIVTTAVLPIITPPEKISLHCEACGACARACPTGALGGVPFDKANCLSHITQKKGQLTPEEQALLRKTGTAWGCDLCQEACPHNHNAAIKPLPEFLAEPIAHVTKDIPLEGRAYAWRGAAVIQRNAALF